MGRPVDWFGLESGVFEQRLRGVPPRKGLEVVQRMEPAVTILRRYDPSTPQIIRISQK